MKKTFLTTALLVVFLMTSFASSGVATKITTDKTKLVEKTLLLDLDMDLNNEEAASIKKQIGQGVLVCGTVTLSCGVKGWVCGDNAIELNDNAWAAEAFHCDFDGKAGQLNQE